MSNSIENLLARGFAALNRGMLEEATNCCKEVLRLKPDLVQGHFMVGLVALEAKDRRTAFNAFRSVTQLKPDHAAAWAHLAKLFMSEGQVNLADEALAKAAEFVGNEPIVHDLLGTVYSLMGEYGLAHDWYYKAYTGQKNYPPFMLNYANNLVYRGETDAANKIFGRIVELQPDSPQAHWSLAGARRAKDQKHIDQMVSLLERKNMHPRARAFYYYAIGKEFEDLENWARAFDAFEAGAKARRSTVEYDEDAEIEMFRTLEALFTPEWLRKAGPGYSTDAPIFVLGQPRTGTTLIDRIISSHSQVYSAGELQQFGLAIRRLSNYENPKRFSAELFAGAASLDFHRVGEMYMTTTERVRGDLPRFVDKLPQNYLMIPMLLAALPNAKIVHLTRDPMDACFSSYKQLFADAYLHSYDQVEMARHHVRYRRLMDTWRERFPGRILDVAYEETVSELEPNARRLIDFLDIPWEPSCLEFHRQASAVATASAVQVREPVHTRSIGRWKRYADRLNPMLETLQKSGVLAASPARSFS